MVKGNQKIIQRFYHELCNAWVLPVADEILAKDVRFVAPWA
jgi:hypothetical protein